MRVTVVVTDDATPIAWANGRSEAAATATVAALCLDVLHQATPAVYPAHRLVTLDDLREALTHRGIRVGSAPTARCAR